MVVYQTTKKGLTTKLMKPWHGPFRIVKMISPVNARLQDVIKKKFKPIVHVSRLKKYIEPSLPKEEMEIIDNDDEEYEVEKILDVKKIKGKKYYLVKWMGYSDEESTWEPEDNLNCEELIRKFHEERKLICKVCNYLAMSEKGLLNHINKHNLY